MLCYIHEVPKSRLSHTGGCWWPGTYTVPGHQQPSWKRRSVSVSQGYMLCILCDMLHLTLKSQSSQHGGCWCPGNHCDDLGPSAHLRGACYVWCVMCYMWHSSHSQSQNAGCWCPGIYTVPRHQQPLWWLRPVSTSQGCMLCMMCDVLHVALKSQSKSECWLLMPWHLYGARTSATIVMT